MSHLQSDQPIGVFDSGVGGLTVANAIKNLLPNEQIIYFGDTAHLPYGDKSADLIQFYSEGIANFLVQQNCKVVLIACNTASAFAYHTVADFLGNKVLLMNVIDPVIEYVAESEKISKIGIIGTKGTVSSGTYPKKIMEYRPDIEVVSLAAPLFVPMIEEAFIYDDISNAIIRSYLSNQRLQNIDSLILGCTHYPIIKNQIRKFFNFQVNVIDSSQIVAQKLKKLLIDNSLLHEGKPQAHQFFVSDYTDFFKKIAEMFFDDDIKLKKIDIWKDSHRNASKN